MALTRSLTAARLPAGKPAIRWASDATKSPSSAAGSARLIQPYLLGQLGVEVLGAEHDLERPRAAHQAHEVLDAAAARDEAERRFRLGEDRRLAGGEAHVAGQHELAAGGAHAALDLGDRDEAARAQVAEHQCERRLAGELGCLGPVLRDLGHVDVRR